MVLYFMVVDWSLKKSKLKLCWSIIKTNSNYACEAWVLKETIKDNLMCG